MYVSLNSQREALQRSGGSSANPEMAANLARQQEILQQHQRRLLERMASDQIDPLPSHITSEMKQLVTAMLSVNPAARPSTEQLLFGSPFVRLLVDGFIAVTQIRPEYKKTRSLISANIQMARFAVGSFSGASRGLGGPATSGEVMRKRYNHARRLALEKAKTRFKTKIVAHYRARTTAATSSAAAVANNNNNNLTQKAGATVVGGGDNSTVVSAATSVTTTVGLVVTPSDSISSMSVPPPSSAQHQAMAASTTSVTTTSVSTPQTSAVSTPSHVPTAANPPLPPMMLPPLPLPRTAVTSIASPIPTHQTLRDIAIDPQNIIIDGAVLKIESDGQATTRYLRISALVDTEAGDNHLKARYLQDMAEYNATCKRLTREYHDKVRAYQQRQQQQHAALSTAAASSAAVASASPPPLLPPPLLQLRIQAASAADRDRWLGAIHMIIALTEAQYYAPCV